MGMEVFPSKIIIPHDGIGIRHKYLDIYEGQSAYMLALDIFQIRMKIEMRVEFCQQLERNRTSKLRRPGYC